MPQNRNGRRRPHSSAPPEGFTLAELLVSLLVGTLLTVAILAMFQLNSRVARVQTEVAEMQQSHRISQYSLLRMSRMIGRGGLPASLPIAGQNRILPEGVAIGVRNNVPMNTFIGDVDTPRVVTGTDVLTVRGILSGTVYQVSPDGFSLPDPTGPGTLAINYLVPGGVPQNLDQLAEAVDRAQNGEPEALVMVSPLGANLYTLAELTGGNVETAAATGTVFRVTLNFRVQGGQRTTEYLNLNPNGIFPTQMTSAAFVGVLEEYRYYVRDARAIPGDNTSQLLPKLSRARFYPGTDDVHPTIPNAQEDIADNVLDLQIALGIDQNNDGVIAEGSTDAERAADEWLFNNPDDPEDDPANSAGWIWNGPNTSLNFLRINTVVRTDRRDRGFRSEPMVRVEDRIYDEPAIPPDGPERLARMFRRRTQQTVVDLRNL